MSDLVLFIIGLLVSFLCLGGTLIHVVVGGGAAKVDEEGANTEGERPADEGR